eukprot:358899-Amphidinium_carterae.1
MSPFSKPAYAMIDSGTSHVLMGIQDVPRFASELSSTSLGLALGSTTASRWHNEVYSEHVKVPLMPMCSLVKRLHLKLEWNPDFQPMLM